MLGVKLSSWTGDLMHLLWLHTFEGSCTSEAQRSKEKLPVPQRQMPWTQL